MTFSVGDRLRHPDDVLDLICQILEVRPTGYTWRYIRAGDGVSAVSSSPMCRYRSDEAADPLFSHGWVLADDPVSTPATW